MNKIKKEIALFIRLIIAVIIVALFIALFYEYLRKVIMNIKTFSDWLFMLCIPMIALIKLVTKSKERGKNDGK